VFDLVESMTHATNGMYDAVMVLALLAPLSDNPTEPSDDFWLFVGSLITIRLVKWFSAVIALELAERRIPCKAEALDLLKHAAWPSLPAVWTAGIAGMAWIGWLGPLLAEDLLTVGNMALMVGLAALARKRAGGEHWRCALYGFGSGAIGLFLVYLKSIF
jgi:hypothetical protein